MLEEVRANRLYEIHEPEARAKAPENPVPKPFFEDVSQRLGHRHEQAPVDDFVNSRLQVDGGQESGDQYADDVEPAPFL